MNRGRTRCATRPAPLRVALAISGRTAPRWEQTSTTTILVKCDRMCRKQQTHTTRACQSKTQPVGCALLGRLPGVSGQDEVSISDGPPAAILPALPRSVTCQVSASRTRTVNTSAREVLPHWGIRPSGSATVRVEGATAGQPESNHPARPAPAMPVLPFHLRTRGMGRLQPSPANLMKNESRSDAAGVGNF